MGSISMPDPVIDDLGNKFWWSHGKLHREDGPAMEWKDGTKIWYLNGKRHREDGPACELANGSKSWYLNGKKYTEEEYVMIQFMNGVNVYV